MVTAPQAPAAANKPRTAKSFSCPSCGGEITLRAAGHSLNAVCAHCGSIIDVRDERLQILQKANAALRPTLLEIGRRGKLFGTVWEVIGYTQKSDKTKQYFWDEYLIFNPYQGFHFLVQQDGHWNYVKIIKEAVAGKRGFSAVTVRGEDYKPFLRDNPIVQYVKGEFYWRVKRGDQARTEDYVAPPFMLSFEFADEDITVSQCLYVEPEAIQSAFSLPSIPRKKGVGPNQPGPPGAAKFFGVMSLALIALLVLYISMYAASANKLLTQFSANYMPADRARVFTSETLEIPKTSNIYVRSTASIDNAWAELDMTLVNDDTKAETELQQEIEYYHGYDSDGAWSEGSEVEGDYFSNVAPGHYHLTYNVDSDMLQKGFPVSMRTEVRRDVLPGSNFLWSMLLIVAIPFIVAYRNQQFEYQRWANSDFPKAGS